MTVRDVVLDVEVADTPYQQIRGLSERDDLAPRSGMLFSFGAPTSGGFYMFRTRMPLSIMFVDEDRVADVAEMTPCLTDLPADCPVYYPSASYTYAVEAAGGTFTNAGVAPGDPVVVAP